MKAECDRLALPLRESFIGETYGQCNEDLLLEALLRPYMALANRPMQDIRYIEIGANHPVHHSSSYLFYRRYGARGVLAEPLPDLCEILAATRPGDRIVNAAVSAKRADKLQFFRTKWDSLSSLELDHLKKFDGAENDLKTLTVDNLHINAFMEQYATDHTDLLAIDTEGVDAEILAALDIERFKPQFIQCEPGDDFNFVLFFLTNNNYRLLAATDVNSIFVRNSASIGPRP